MLFIWENQESKKDKKNWKWILLFLPYQESTIKGWIRLFTIKTAHSYTRRYLNIFWSKKAHLISARITDDECNIHITNEVCLEFHENCGGKCNHIEHNMNWIPCMESCFDLTILECSWKYSSGNKLLHNLLSHILNSGKNNDYNCVTEVDEIMTRRSLTRSLRQ